VQGCRDGSTASGFKTDHWLRARDGPPAGRSGTFEGKGGKRSEKGGKNERVWPPKVENLALREQELKLIKNTGNWTKRKFN